jgi:hypothetical protein
MTIIAIVVSLLVSASNAAKIVAAQALGEEEFYRFTANILLKNSPALVLLFLLLPALFYIILGFTLLLFYNDPGFDWGFYFALGLFNLCLCHRLSLDRFLLSPAPFP